MWHKTKSFAAVLAACTFLFWVASVAVAQTGAVHGGHHGYYNEDTRANTSGEHGEYYCNTYHGWYGTGLPMDCGSAHDGYSGCYGYGPTDRSASGRWGGHHGGAGSDDGVYGYHPGERAILAVGVVGDVANKRNTR